MYTLFVSFTIFKLKGTFLAGSLENVLCTAASAGDSAHIELLVNHASPAMFARSVFLLSLISHPSFNIEKKSDADYLWDVMYNQMWPKVTERRFINVAKELLSSQFNGNIKLSKSEDLVAVKSVARQWLKILQTKSFDSFIDDRYVV